MTCPTCHQPTARMRIYEHGAGCAACLGLSEAGGAKVDGLLTRNSDRIREQQRRFEGDMIPPHIVDKVSRKAVPNPDFMARYPDKIASNYTQSELERAGHSKAGEIFKAAKATKEQHARDQASGVTFRGNTNKPIAPPV